MSTYYSRLTTQDLEDDDLEKIVHTIAMTYPVYAMDTLLTAIEGYDHGLCQMGVMTAGLFFQRYLLKNLRCGRLTRDSLVSLLKETIYPDVILPRVFDRAIFLFGIRRSGNHAVIEWLKGHFDQNKVLFLNNAEPSLFYTTEHHLSVDTDKYRKILIEEHQHKTCLIVSYENCNPLVYPLFHNSNIAYRTDALILLRDFPNTAGSIARSARDQPAFAYRFRIRDFPELWCIYAKFILSGAPGFSPILYNDWFKSSTIRSQLSETLGLELSDLGLNRVSNFGQGSSFDGLTYDGNAQSMDVLNRWKTMIDDHLFQFLLLAEEEALPLNNRLFGGFNQSYSDILSLWHKR